MQRMSIDRGKGEGKRSSAEEEPKTELQPK